MEIELRSGKSLTHPCRLVSQAEPWPNNFDSTWDAYWGKWEYTPNQLSISAVQKTYPERCKFHCKLCLFLSLSRGASTKPTPGYTTWSWLTMVSLVQLLVHLVVSPKHLSHPSFNSMQYRHISTIPHFPRLFILLLPCHANTSQHAAKLHCLSTISFSQIDLKWRSVLSVFCRVAISTSPSSPWRLSTPPASTLTPRINASPKTSPLYLRRRKARPIRCSWTRRANAPWTRYNRQTRPSHMRWEIASFIAHLVVVCETVVDLIC